MKCLNLLFAQKNFKSYKMSTWLFTTSILTGYGFLKEFRPGVPFLNQYLLSFTSSNFTDEILSGQVYPVWTYSYLATLIPVMLLTDFLKYKPIIISEATTLAVVWAILLWGRTVEHLQLMQAFYGWATAAEVAYYSYIYSAVEQGCYQKVTSLVRGAVLSGKFFGYGLGQILVFAEIDNALKLLNYISFGAVCTAVVISLFIPRIKFKSNIEINRGNQISGYFTKTIRNLKNSYSDPFIIKWSIWWAASTCVFIQTGNYIQVLWSQVGVGHDSQTYNGLVEALNTLFCAGAAFCVQFIRINWSLIGEISLGFISALQAICLIFLSITSSMTIAYILYVIFCVLYQALITIATFNVASRLEESSHGLIFGVNTFLALILQTIITIVLVDHRGLNLPVHIQFSIYGSIQVILAVVFTFIGAMFLYRKRPLTLEMFKSRYDSLRIKDLESKENELTKTVSDS